MRAADTKITDQLEHLRRRVELLDIGTRNQSASSLSEPVVPADPVDGPLLLRREEPGGGRVGFDSVVMDSSPGPGLIGFRLVLINGFALISRGVAGSAMGEGRGRKDSGREEQASNGSLHGISPRLELNVVRLQPAA